jgi:hypothetical protein
MRVELFEHGGHTEESEDQQEPRDQVQSVTFVAAAFDRSTKCRVRENHGGHGVPGSSLHQLVGHEAGLREDASTEAATSGEHRR